MNRITLVTRHTASRLLFRGSSHPCVLPFHHVYSTSSAEKDPRPPSHHDPTPPPQPPKAGVPYWETMSSAIGDPPAVPSPPPKEQSPLSGRIENVQIHIAPGVELRSHHQGQVIGGLLDLLGGQLEKDVLAFWRDDAVLVNPIAEARGRAEVLAYWHAYRGVFAAIKTNRHEIVRAEGSEVEVDVDREFKFRGAFGRGARGRELKSKVKVQMDGEGRISKLEDCWTGLIWFPKFVRRATSLILKRAVKVPAED